MVWLAALAQPNRAAAEDAHRGQGDRDGHIVYAFPDDPLTALDGPPTGASIVVRRFTVRTILVRPRVSFVPEMLKSVEAM